MQAAAYDVQLLGDAEKQRELMPQLIAHYHGYLRIPPLEWQFMPMLPEGASEFTARFPEAAANFDNLHMLHDTISDILASERLPAWEAKRQEIYRALDAYYLASADTTNPMIVREKLDGPPVHRHE